MQLLFESLLWTHFILKFEAGGPVMSRNILLKNLILNALYFPASSIYNSSNTFGKIIYVQIV